LIPVSTRERLRYIGILALLTAAYVVGGRLGFTAAAIHPVVSSAWPPSGIALAALLLLGKRYWPAIALGAFLVNATAGVGALPSAGIAIGNTLEAVVAAWALTHLAGFRPSLQRLRDVLALAAIGAVGGAAIAATIGTGVLAAAGSTSPTSPGTIWLAWFTGDAIGILIVTPLIAAWATAPRTRVSARDFAEATALAVILVASTMALFQIPFSYVYAIFPITIWAALRFGPRGATTASAVASVLAIWYTVRGYGPFATSTAVDNLFELQAFIALLAIPNLILAATIAERRKTEAELQRSRQQHRDIIHYASVGIFQSSRDGTILLANPALARILGYDSPEELIGLNAAETVYLSTTERTAVVDRVEALAEGDALEMQWKRRDGSAIWVDLRARPVRDPDGKTAYFEGFVYDLTGRKKLESQFQQAQKMEAVGRLAGGVAHDFNNLLTVIASCTDFILGDATLPESHREDLIEVKKATDRATSLTRQLLAFGRTQVLRPSTLDLNERLAELLPMLKRLFETNIGIRIEPGPQLWAVRADPTQVEQVLLNLALNARDAMPQGGELTFSTENVVVAMRSPTVSQDYTMKPGEYVLLRVRDTGAGMDLETQTRVFEPFFTTKEIGRGTGLGLATAYGIVKQSGGYIRVRSAPGQGTEFLIYLPRTDAPLPVKTAAPAVTRNRIVTGTVLLVEDELPVRQALQRLLTAEGYEVFTASDGAEALVIFEGKKEQIDLLITDIVMPTMDGRALAEKCCAMRSALKVIFMSGYTRDSLLSQQTFEDETVLIEKPFTRDSVLARIADVMAA
jgi:PAS domain S-box-containing protein